MQKLEGNVVDVRDGIVFPGEILFDEKIRKIIPNDKHYTNYICPGFIDAHIHIESSMLTPFGFSKVAAVHGTSAIIADPHEIANVLGLEGIDFMVKNSKGAYIDIYFSAPSCVPATPFETSGAKIASKDIAALLDRDEFVALGEMMNYPGVIAGDYECMAKIRMAKLRSKPVDGHCPNLSGDDLKRYVQAGISTEHECTTAEEAEEKARLGMKILAREGSSAKDLENLVAFDGLFAFCSDDKHVDDLITLGHMDHVLKKAVSLGMDPLKALRMATLNPASHYKIEGGVVEEGAVSNLALLSNLKGFRPIAVYHHGKLVSRNGRPVNGAAPYQASIIRMNAKRIYQSDLELRPKIQEHVIVASENSLITGHKVISPSQAQNYQKMVIVDRYCGIGLSVALTSGLEMENCALAQTIAHDSHNIISTGSPDELIIKAVNHLIEIGGGIVACSHDKMKIVHLDVAGLMSTQGPNELAKEIHGLLAFTEEHGCKIKNIVTTLSFMALPVIPHLKLTDRGLFDVDKFSFIEDNKY